MGQLSEQYKKLLGAESKKTLSEQLKAPQREPKETLSQAYQRLFVDSQPPRKSLLEALKIDQTSFLEKLRNSPM